MSNKWPAGTRYRTKQGIYNSIIIGEDACDECMPCAWYGRKCAGNKRCRYRPMKFRKVTMKKIEKYRKEHEKMMGRRMKKRALEKEFNVKLVKTREQIDSHRAYWEVWYNCWLIINAWTLAEAQEKLSNMPPFEVLEDVELE